MDFMEKYLISSCLLILFVFLFAGCAAILPFISSILGSKAGFIFIPLLKDDGIVAASSESKIPGMILLFENNPPQGYGPLSGAIVTIGGVSVLTGENGCFFH